MQRLVAVLNNCSPRWFETLVVLLVVPRNEFKSNPDVKSADNKPFKSKEIPLDTSEADVGVDTSTIFFFIESRLFFKREESVLDFIEISASVSANKASI